MLQAADAARATKITGMMLELDAHEILSFILFPDVRSSKPGTRLHFC